MLKSIKNKTEYEEALERIYNLMQLNLVKGSLEGNELKALSLLVHAYEEAHFPMTWKFLPRCLQPLSHFFEK